MVWMVCCSAAAAMFTALARRALMYMLDIERPCVRCKLYHGLKKLAITPCDVRPCKCDRPCDSLRSQRRWRIARGSKLQSDLVRVVGLEEELVFAHDPARVS